jgi:hypothetical protein
MPAFDRPASGNRFSGVGLRTTDVPDALPPNRSPYLQNTREYSQDHIRSRPQMAQIIAPVLDDPVVSFEANLGIYSEGGSLCFDGTAIDTGYSATGSSLIPFRPNASPQSYEYVFDANKYKKVSPANALSNIGIIEPQAPPDAYVPPANYYNEFTPSSASDFTAAGSCGAPSLNSNPSVTVENVFFLPSGGSFEQYITLNIPGLDLRSNLGLVINGEESWVADIFPGWTYAINVAGIYYYSGTSGACVVVPSNIGIGPGQGSSIYDPRFMQSMRRGAIIQIGAEVCQILGVVVGPDGSVAFTTSTTGTHTTSDTIVGLTTLKTRYTGATVGQTVTASFSYSSTITAPGVGTLSAPLSVSPFVLGGYSFQPDDYIHISLLAFSLEDIIEIKVIFDVNNGSATYDTNAYYYTIRPNDIQAGISNDLTQLGVAQIVSQRALIDEEQAAEANNKATTSSSDQTTPGDRSWSEIVFPITALTRIGNDQTRTLADVQGIQILVNSTNTGNFTFEFGNFAVFGGGQLDVGATGIPIKYRIRPRSSATGAKGNPSPEMLYEVTCRRDNAYVVLPSTYPDPQMDTWDIFRQGGALPNYTFAGTVPLGVTEFIDQYNDSAVQGNNILETNLYQPFPTIDNPFVATANIVGTACVLTISSPNPAGNVLRYLPGNILTVGQNNYSLRFRPTLISTGVYYMELTQNAGVYSAVQANIYEPLMAQETLPFVWGPDANGRLFGAGDSYRPGFIYTTNPNDPDSADDNAEEVCPPNEPIQNGALLGGTSLAASVNRWWKGYPQDSGSYNWTEIPVGVGLEFPWAICSDGKSVYFAGKDGLYMTSGGPAQSLTDEDLYNIFPHEDVYPQAVTYNGKSIIPPSYGLGLYFRLAAVNGYLFFDYVGIDDTHQTLVLNLRTRCWSKDVCADQVTVRATISTPPGSTGSGPPTPNQQMFCGTAGGAISQEVSNPTSGSGEIVQCYAASNEDMMGDIRAPKLYGDASLDCLPLSAITATPMFLGVAYGTSETIAVSSTRELAVVDVAGGYEAQSMGMFIAWSDQGVQSKIYAWQPSYIVKPELTQGRYEDWNDSGVPGNKFYQGFILEANTYNSVKGLVVRDADTLTTHSFAGESLSPNQILHNGQSIQAYAFAAPFRAHSVRYEATDAKPWQKFDLKYVFEPTPEFALYWESQQHGFGIDGYKHLQRGLFSYCSTSAVALVITVDGRSYSYALPSTAGFYQKNEVIFGPFLKGFIYTFAGSSAQPWAIWTDDTEMLVKGWGNPGPYQRLKILGSDQGLGAKV